MIDFIFRRKPIHIDCLTSNQTAYEYASIDHASNFIPDWWKKLPKSYDHPSGVGSTATMKSCAGFVDLYSKGLIIPLWSDLIIVIEGTEYKWRFADAKSQIIMHDSQQSGTFLNDIKCFHLKLVAPWEFFCKEDIPWHFSQPVWNDYASRDYCTPSGIVEYKNQHTVAIQTLIRHPIFIPKKEIIINHRHPMAHIVPLSERPIKIHTHLVSESEIKQVSDTTFSFRSGYYKAKKINEDKNPNKLKCPFGFKLEK
jgi:hypothetical protein